MVLIAHLAPENRLALNIEKNIQFQTIHNDPNLVAHLAPEDGLAFHLALFLSSIAALLNRLLATLASVLSEKVKFSTTAVRLHVYLVFVKSIEQELKIQ